MLSAVTPDIEVARNLLPDISRGIKCKAIRTSKVTPIAGGVPFAVTGIQASLGPRHFRLFMAALDESIARKKSAVNVAMEKKLAGDKVIVTDDVPPESPALRIDGDITAADLDALQWPYFELINNTVSDLQTGAVESKADALAMFMPEMTGAENDVITWSDALTRVTINSDVRIIYMSSPGIPEFIAWQKECLMLRTPEFFGYGYSPLHDAFIENINVAGVDSRSGGGYLDLSGEHVPFGYTKP